MSNATELLRRALEAWDNPSMSMEIMFNEIRAFLDAEPEVEPVAWMFQHEDTGLIDYVDTQQVEWGFEKNNLRWQKIGPVYLHPPSPEPKRKPMTEDEEDEAFNSASKWAAWLETENRMLREARKPMTDEEIVYEFGIPRNGTYFIEGVFAGVRFAEKHHGISPRRENS